MSKQKDSDDLVRVGPGTAMGEMMRQYWIPALMSSELVRDGAPGPKQTQQPLHP